MTKTTQAVRLRLIHMYGEPATYECPVTFNGWEDGEEPLNLSAAFIVQQVDRSGWQLTLMTDEPHHLTDDEGEQYIVEEFSEVCRTLTKARRVIRTYILAEYATPKAGR